MGTSLRPLSVGFYVTVSKVVQLERMDATLGPLEYVTHAEVLRLHGSFKVASIQVSKMVHVVHVVDQPEGGI